jgi:acyl carrier protein
MNAVEDAQRLILDYLKTEVLVDDGAAALTPESPLLQGRVDSLGLNQLIGFLEDEFEIEVDDDDMREEHFATVSTITRLVTAKAGLD